MQKQQLSVRTPLLTEKQAGEFLTRSLSSLRRDRRNGRGPTYIRLGRSVRYRLADLEAYLEANASREVPRA